MSAPRTALDFVASKPGLAHRAIELADLLKTVLRVLRNRNAVVRLSDLSDSQLLDIGLTRDDLAVAATSSFFSDTGTHLTRAARQRVTRYYGDLRRD